MTSTSTSTSTSTFPWQDEAECIGVHPDVFFEQRHVAEAKAICSGCLVRDECREAVIDEARTLGVWGGLTADERTRIRQRRRADAAAARIAARRQLRAVAALPVEERSRLERLITEVAASHPRAS